MSRLQYSTKVKNEAVNMYLTSSNTMVAVAEKFDIPKGTLYDWIRRDPRYTFTPQSNSRPVTDKKEEEKSPTDILRIKLYNQLKEEYQQIEQQLREVHRRMTMVGEQWK